MITAKRRIPEILAALPQTGGAQNQHAKLMGYMMGYLCIISGHRSVVLTNMLWEHVVNADRWMEGKRFQILVSTIAHQL